MSVIRKFRKMTSWLRALRDRFGGIGTFSGRSASLADLGMIGPLLLASPRPKGTALLSFASLTIVLNPDFASFPCLVFPTRTPEESREGANIYTQQFAK